MDIPENYEIAALVPEYTAEGDSTHVYLRDGGELMLPVTLRTTLKYLAYRSCRDLTRLRSWAAEHTHCTLNNPLPVDEELVLVPFKVREPRVHGDPIMGCVNAAAGVTIKPAKARSIKVTKPVNDKAGNTSNPAADATKKASGSTPKGENSSAAALKTTSTTVGTNLKPGSEAILVTAGGHELLSLWSKNTTQKHLDRGILLCQELRGILDEKLLRRLQKLSKIKV